MDELFHTCVQYAVVVMGGIMGYLFKSIQGKASVEEFKDLKTEVHELRDKMFSLLETLATKEDVNKLETKLDRLIEREIDKGRKR